MQQKNSGERFVKEWQDISGILVDTVEVSEFVSDYFSDSRTEEEFGMAYLKRLGMRYPRHSGLISLLMGRPGAGAYITHWFLEQAGVVCR